LKLNLALEVLHPPVPSTWVVTSERMILSYSLLGELGRLTTPPFPGLFWFWWVHSILFEPLPFKKLVRFPLMIICSSSLVSSRFYGSGWRIKWWMYR
jgi:hypothetical protein